ncbi:MFS transporter [Stappia sp.]|uniref:MFS transporter n=1 Tax=Stappia sp. TaxID=1870903 RepID=UPI003A98F438
MQTSSNRPETRLATRLAFFAAGFAVACWAPLVPFAKANAGVDDGALGLLLLCLGIGSIVAMPVTGWVSARFGSRPIILAGGFALVAILPLLALVADPRLLGITLFAFGAALGAIDVAMNVHAVEVERDADRPLMSGFHAMFSVGGFVGAGGMTLLLSQGLTPFTASLCCSVLTLAAMVLAGPRLLRARGGDAPTFVAPRGIVLLVAALAGITFLVEGAILDWSALLAVGMGLVDKSEGGLGYMLFASAMTLGRLTGDRIVARAGNRRILLGGGLTTVAGIALLLTAPWPSLAMAGFALIGLGASNIVPVLFSIAGHQKVMPSGLAVAAVTTTGYAGVLLGPAAVGLVSRSADLPTAFWIIAVLMLAVPLLARTATRA